MSTPGSFRAAARLLSLALTLAALTACANAPTDPAQRRSIESATPRLDGSDTTDAESDTTNTRGCDHTQGWGCA